jgi:D-sedoheptulose 7-phosphate isomerase
MSYTDEYLAEVKAIIDKVDRAAIEKMACLLVDIRKRGGRLFFLGIGGGAANASHAVNDFRKIAGIECYSPWDNPSELTARINDDGWEDIFVEWLKGSRLNGNDGIFIFSVGGGNRERNVSVNLVRAMEYAAEAGARVLGIVGRDGGYTGRMADACVIVPTANNNTVTPHTESFQSVIWHLLVSHPLVRTGEMKWESMKEQTTNRA